VRGGACRVRGNACRVHGGACRSVQISASPCECVQVRAGVCRGLHKVHAEVTKTSFTSPEQYAWSTVFDTSHFSVYSWLNHDYLIKFNFD